MADDKSNVGEPDRSRVSGSGPYEVSYLAGSTGFRPSKRGTSSQSMATTGKSWTGRRRS